MSEKVSFHAGVTLAGGAPFLRADARDALALAPHPVAVDGGADALMAHRITPEAVVGDMDSLRGEMPETVRILPIHEQDSNDFAKGLTHINAPFYIGVGFLGGRVDHTLAALSTLLEHAEKRVVLLGQADVAFIAPSDWTMTVEPGTRVSFFPLVPCRGVASSGLRWPVEGLSMAAGGQIGTSNEAINTQIAASFEPQGVVTILPKRYLATVVAGFGQRAPDHRAD